ncbi:MAG: AI-2E family transporter [Ignavibacteriaceae bacterium]
MAKEVNSDNTVKYFIALIGIAVLAFVLKELGHILLPFIIAYFLFFFFSPLNTFLSDKKVPQFLIIILNICITVFIIWITFDFIVGSFLRFTEEAPVYAEKINKIVRATAVSLDIRDKYFTQFSIEEIIRKLDYKIIAGGIFSSGLSLAGSVLFVLFFFVFIMIGHNTIYNAISRRFVSSAVRDEDKMIRKITEEHTVEDEEAVIKKLNKEKKNKELKLAQMFKSITGQIQRYIIAKVAVNLGAGILVYIVLLILDIDFPLIWALFAFLFNFIPSIGSAAALILPVLMSLIQYESTGFALLVALLLGLIQTLAFNIAEPAIIGKHLNLNPLLILFSLLVWGYIWGIIGMLLSVPLTAIIKIIVSNSESEDMKFLSSLMSKE